MARLRTFTLPRDEVEKHVKEAKKQNKNRHQFVREELIKEYPGIETQTIVRNGKVYKVLDYLMDDIDSYDAG